MPAIDLTTLIIVTLTVNLVVAGYMALLAALHPQQIAFRHWALSCLVFVIASLLAISRHYQSPEILSGLLAYFLLALPPILVGTGILRFVNSATQPLPLRRLLCCAMAYGLMLIICYPFVYSAEILAALAISLGSWWCLALLQQLSTPLRISRLLQAVLALHALTMLAKAALYSGYWPERLSEQALTLKHMMLVSHLLLTTVAALLLPLLFFITREQQLMRQADLDDLTSLPNRRHFLRESTHFIAQQSTNTPITIMMLDLDHFKAINDSFGHATGDIALQKVAKILMQELRKTDFIGRVGGEEFAVVMPNTTEDEARIISERLLKQVERQARTINGRVLGLTVSIGAIFSPTTHHADLQALLKQADDALYQSKRQGRNRVTFCHAL